MNIDFGGAFITLYSKKKLFLSSFTENDIVIEDIAHALSNVCRYGGQGLNYPVAQHCEIMSRYVSKKNALWALLHDAAEAYVGDMIKPLKDLLPEFTMIEDMFFEKVKIRFGLQGKMPEEVRFWDRLILHSEAPVILGIDPVAEDWNLPDKLSKMPVIKPWTHKTAEKRFLKRFHQLTKKAA